MGKFIFWQGMERSVHPMMRERAVGVGEKILLPGPIEPALAMSDNIPALRRLTSLHATVKEVKYENSVYTVVAYCE